MVTNAPAFTTMYASALASIPDNSRAQPGIASGLAPLQAAAFSFPNLASGALIAPFLDYGFIRSFPETDLQSILQKLYEDFALNTKSVLRRNMTYGAVSAATVSGGANSGSGNAYRLTVDQYGFNIESGAPELKTLRCVQDAFSGTNRDQEVFEMRGAAISSDIVPWPGQGAFGQFVKVSSINDTPIQNAGFEQYSTADGSFTGWHNSDGDVWTDYAEPGAAFAYKTIPNVTARCLRFGPAAFPATNYIYQDFQDQAIRWNPGLPMFAQLAWNNRNGTATGTLKFKIGSIEVTVDVATGAAGVWNILSWPGSTRKNAWNYNWNAQDAQVRITMDTQAVSVVDIDDVIIAPYQQWDGSWFAIAGGATPFLRNDTLYWSDTDPGTAVIQRWLPRAFPGFYLPPSAAPTWSDPA